VLIGSSGSKNLSGGSDDENAGFVGATDEFGLSISIGTGNGDALVLEECVIWRGVDCVIIGSSGSKNLSGGSDDENAGFVGATDESGLSIFIGTGDGDALVLEEWIIWQGVDSPLIITGNISPEN